MSEENAMVIERVLDAPVEIVWKAWSEEEHFKQWWGPKEFSCPVISIDFRVGGKFLGCMRGPMPPDNQEKDVWSTGTYKEIIPMKKIVTTDSFADEQGNIVPGSHYGMGGMPLEMVLTVTFEPQGNKTKMTIIHEGMPAGEHQKGADEGWNSMLDKLATHVEGMKG